MSNKPEQSEETADEQPQPLLKPRDQMSLLALAVSLLVLMISYWLYRGGHRGEMIHIDRAPPLQAQFQVDVNRADCSDWTSLQFMESLVFTASELPEVPFDDRIAPAVDTAKQFLLVALASGPRHCRDLIAEAADAGLSRSSLYRAQRRLALPSIQGVWSLTT